MRNDTDFYKLLDIREQIENKKSSIESDMSRLKGSYDTVLLEKIANQPKDASISETSAGTIKQDLQKRTEELGRVIEEQKMNLSQIEANIHLQ